MRVLRYRRWLVAALLCVIVLSFGLCCISWGVVHEVCLSCGARSSVKHLSVLGRTFQYGRRTMQGPLSDCVQLHRGIRCKHIWLCAYDSSYARLSRARSLASGHSLYSWIGKVEGVPDAASRLKRIAATRPAFADELESVLRSRDPDKVDSFFEKLISELRVE